MPSLILPPEILNATPRKVAPKGIVFATVAVGMILAVTTSLLIAYGLGHRDQDLKTIVILIGLLDGLILVPLVVLPLTRFRNEARLLKWGVARRARIVSRSIATGRGGNHLALTYEFTDEAGRTVRGSRALWGDISLNGRTSDPKILDALTAPTVFYDRAHSERHLFYPSGVADIRR